MRKMPLWKQMERCNFPLRAELDVQPCMLQIWVPDLMLPL